MNYTLGEICSILQADFIGEPSLTDAVVKDIFIDSRKVRGGEAGIFWALSGDQNDGHKYIQEAYLLGIRAFVLSNREYLPTDLLDDVSIHAFYKVRSLNDEDSSGFRSTSSTHCLSTVSDFGVESHH